MPFRKKNQLGAKKFLARPLDAHPLTVRIYQGQRSALRAIPGWQDKIRAYIDKLIAENTEEDKETQG